MGGQSEIVTNRMGYMEKGWQIALTWMSSPAAWSQLVLLLTWLESLTIEMGNLTFSVMALLRGAIAGSLLFWLGSWSNRQSSDYIKPQQELRPATRERAAKAAEIAIFGAAVLLLLNIMGIDLTTVAVLGGAVGVGIEMPYPHRVIEMRDSRGSNA